MSDTDYTDEIANKLTERLMNGRKILEACEKQVLTSLIVRGKTLKEWGEELRVNIPENPDDIAALEVATSQIGNKIQEAEYVLAAFELQAGASANFHDAGFARKYVTEMEDRKGEKIAAEKFRQLVLTDELVDARLSAAQTARLIADFFKRIVKGLEEARKDLENRTRLLGLRLRFLNDNYSG